MRDARWRSVERVADSALFQRPSRLRDLFLYICENSLQGHNEELREQRIGEVVFGRGSDFRPNDDTIVRVEVRKLRKRLDEYFATEGKDEPLIVSIPKGAYVASFESRMPVALPAEAGESASSGRADPAITLSRHPRRWSRVALVSVVILAITTVLFGALAAWYAVRDQQSARVLAYVAAQKNPLWNALFNKEQQTYIVCADSALALYEDLTGGPVTLSDYVNRNYGAPAGGAPEGLKDLLGVLPRRQYTGISDVRLVQGLLQLNHEYPGRTTVRHSRDMQLIDFKNGNFVLIGSRHADPWVELFESSLNFRFVFDFKTQRPGFRNMNPGPNEKSIYWRQGNVTQGGETYSVISFVPNVAHNGGVLMVAGATGEGTEAAGEYLTHPGLLDELLKAIHAVDHDRVRYFEVLLKSGTLGGTSERGEIVAYRLLPNPR
jgi:hypothetical protein